MKRFNFFISLLIFIGVVTSCSDDQMVQNESNPGSPQATKGINAKAKTDGLSYSLTNIVINPNAVTINADNASLVSSKKEAEQGTIKLSNVESSISDKLAVGSVLYIQTEGYTGLRKIDTIALEAGTYKLETSQAQLGEFFEEGSLEFSVDLNEANKAASEKNPLLRASQTSIYEILNLHTDYNFGDEFIYNPNTDLKMMFHVGMKFDKFQILPSEFTTVFEMKSEMLPTYHFAKAINKNYETDLIKVAPQQLIDYIKAQEFEIKIPLSAKDSLPAKIKIQDINIPTAISASLLNNTTLALGFGGSFKAGFTTYCTGLSTRTVPVYENTLTKKVIDAPELRGEVLSDLTVVMVPNISVLNDLYKVNGTMSFALNTISTGYIDPATKKPVTGSKGVFNSKLAVNVDLILTQVPVDIINESKELWNVGTLAEKKLNVTYSSSKVAAGYRENPGLSLRRFYDADLAFKYSYPYFPGKLISTQAMISYEIVNKTKKTVLVTVKDQQINLEEVVADGFKLSLEVPYAGIKIFTLTSFDDTSYIRNIKIKDKFGYESVVSGEFALKRP